MDAFLRMPAEDQRAAYEQAESSTRLPAASIEKDLWVCWALRELFALPEIGPHLTFKGGTSLSKAWALIERFSEDIDIVIDRDFLGFGGAHSPEVAPSRKKQRQWLEELRAASQAAIRNSLHPAFRLRVAEKLPRESAWSVEADPDDPDAQTLLFSYPSVFGGASYVAPRVKIELGSRSDTDPAETPGIEPYLAGSFPMCCSRIASPFGWSPRAERSGRRRCFCTRRPIDRRTGAAVSGCRGTTTISTALFSAASPTNPLLTAASSRELLLTARCFSATRGWTIRRWHPASSDYCRTQVGARRGNVTTRR
jgi:hypothetical protein